MEDFETTIVERLTRIETKIDNGIISKLSDHEKRLRFIERGFYMILGVSVVLQIVLKVFIK